MTTLALSTPDLYTRMIAGCVEAARAGVRDAVAAIAGQTLGERRVHLLAAGDAEHVYYMALPSNLLAAGVRCETPLAMALPGHPRHRGDGVYVLASAPSVAAVKRHGSLALLCDVTSPQELARQYGLALHSTDASVAAWPFQSADDLRRDAIGAIAARVARLSCATVGASVTLYLLLSLGDVLLDHADRAQPAAASVAPLVKRIQYASPLSEQLAQIQRVFGTVVRAGGWIEGYTWSQRKGEAFEITLPGWVSRDYIEALGRGTVTEQNVADNLVLARKGKFEKADPR